MTGFSNKTLFALLLSAGSAWAAPGTPPHSTAPSFEEGVMDSDTGEQGDQPEVAVQPGGSISESSVSAPPIDGFGTLEQGKGALPEDIWKVSAHDATDPLLREIRAGVADETLRGLLTGLLMTQANPPQGAGRQSWFLLRVNALIAIGADDKAGQMVASLPASMTDASLLELETSLKLARGEYDHACQKAQPGALPPDDNDDGFWRKLSILCQAYAGKQDEAMVGIDLMREERHVDDLFFQEAIRRIGDKTSPVRANPKQWSPLNVALLRIAGDMEKLKNNMDAFPPVAVKYIAQDASLDVKLRERATARAQQLGVLPGSEGSKTPEQPFARPLASDVTTLVAALRSGKAPNDADNAVIARLALDDAGIGDSRRIQRLLTLMEPFGYHVPPEVWEKLFIHRERFDGEMPPATLIARINDAALSGKRGEVIVLAGLITGDTEVDKVSDLGLLPVIKALIAVGFEKEARSVAYEAVKGYSAR
jgi:hypothetical protein